MPIYHHRDNQISEVNPESLGWVHNKSCDIARPHAVRKLGMWCWVKLEFTTTQSDNMAMYPQPKLYLLYMYVIYNVLFARACTNLGICPSAAF
jgi:hypothetical protein